MSRGAGATTDMVAPGTGTPLPNTGYGLMDGTSMAAPLTGIAANTRALAPHLTGAQISRRCGSLRSHSA